MNRLDKKTVLITGASAGIGEACAHAFAQQGARAVLWARREERLRELAAGLEKRYGVEAPFAVVDVRDRQSVRAALERGPGARDIDILVNNAGLASGLSRIHEGDYEDWDRMIDTNIKGLLNVTREILPAMVARDAGHVINIGSVAGHMAYPQGNVYNATKFAVRGLNDAMNIDLLGTRVRVSSVDPGAAETEFSAVRFHGDSDRARAVYEGFTPLVAEDVAEAVVFVANRPPHVNVVDMVVLPTDQRNPYLIHRRETSE